jgi:DNA sulfur modification protein DndD
MILRRLTLSNVGLYRGDQTLEFSRDRNAPVTLIGGKNGTGKTTLLNAIQLALYGSRAKSLLGVSAYPEYLNELIHRDCPEASISLEFERRESGMDVRYLIERGWVRAANGKPLDSLYVTVNDKPRPDLEANWPDFVEGVMPLSVAGLAIFDGEKIEALADMGSSAEVLRTAINGLLGLDLIDRLQRDLVDYRRRAARQTIPSQNDLAVRLKQAEDQLAVTLADSDASANELKAAEQALDLATAELAAAKDRLADSGGDMFSIRERLHAEFLSAESISLATTRRLESVAAGDLPLLMVRPLLRLVMAMGERSQLATDAAMLLVRMKERDERLIDSASKRLEHFPPDVLAAFASLLDDDRRNYEAVQHVAYSVGATATATAKELLGAAGQELVGEMERLIAELSSSTVTAELARRSLESVPTGDAIEGLVRAAAEAEAHVREADRALKAARERRADSERHVGAARREVDKLATQVLEAGVSDSDALRISREADRAQHTLTRFSARIVAQHMERISENITWSLRALLRKERLVTRLAIDPATLHITLYDRNGNRIDPGQLSAGERQMLATAVLWGLSKSAGRTLPMVIDTPVGRLDSSHRTNLVTQYFPFAARQVVLLSTDEEIVGAYLAQLHPYIGRQYLLSYDNGADLTEIKEGYFA